MFKIAAIVLVAIVVYGTLQTARELEKEFEMQGSHWIMLLVVLAAGYAAGRFFPQAGHAVGLP